MERRIRTADSPHVLHPVPEHCEGSADQFFFFYGALAKSRKATIIFVMSVRLTVRPHGTGRIFIKFDIGVFFENLSRKFKFR